ncbi:biotin-dependent carboxyltransferase [Jiangella aurantiaca]|uniref:Biotin-dependent carboxyltransferase n=1 Tax=Jiangella aurantiaca TaxID=2530373 RepID=A0A4R5A260_9ACTN|nr:biotin-dependent carboxyltransferase family protein [Jiangella aurantiaca]TDD64886.1 biotin-dependent carboxyltransferase [Jiangella aurantiaca]
MTAGREPVLEVLEPGLLAIVQDLGRPGLGAMGVGRAGAADEGSFRLANRLVGNAELAAAIEFVLGGLAIRFRRTATVALTGAPADVRAGERAAAFNAPFSVRAGEVLRVARPARGLRGYLAVRGGLGVTPVLGSRSWDSLAGIGPPPLRAGDLLPLADDHDGEPFVDVAPVRAPLPPLSGAATLRVLPGPRADRFAASALDRLFVSAYEVTADSDRVGLRLAGPPLPAAPGVAAELPPEGMVTGALQVPPSGRPVLFLADHPVTGGYPVVGVVLTADLPLAAQLRPGDEVRFRPTAPAAGVGGGGPVAAASGARWRRPLRG